MLPQETADLNVRGLQKSLKRIRKSLWAYHINTGGCNGCDIEILDVLTPWFDVERFGVKLVASPRHADLALITGPITITTLPRVVKALRAMPRPRFILAVGSCAVGGNIWFRSYSTIGGVPEVLGNLRNLGIAVDGVTYVPGCPARPEAIIYGVAVLLGLIKPRTCYKRAKAE